jgi:CBS domain containing-hemolysin-like protein
MRGAASHLAAVADGSGRVLGVAALEDVLEMLVGEVHDPAHGTAGTAPRQRGGDGSPGAVAAPAGVTPAEAADRDADRPAPGRTAPHRTPA